jgi:3-oxoacyl-[acyl-carrier protein] reductase
MRFTGKTAVVTGAGNGIGREYATGFASEGADVLVLDIDSVGVAETVAHIESGGGRARGLTVDITDDVAVKSAIEEGVDAFGSIDVLINNAGLHLGRYNETSTLPLWEWRRILDVNVVGALICATACRPYLATSGSGVILNQSSMAAYLPAGGAYGVSKLALNGLTISLAAEFAPDVRVVGIAPGMIGSPAVLQHLAPEHKDLVSRGQLVKRFGEMADLVGMALFLCSDEASFITGQTYLVDGGFLPRP